MAHPGATTAAPSSLPPLAIRVEMEYTDAEGASTRRSIRPLAYISGGNGHRYLRAYCYLRCDERTFRVDRIRGWKLSGEAQPPVPAGVLRPESSPIAASPAAYCVPAPPRPKRGHPVLGLLAAAAVIAVIHFGFQTEGSAPARTVTVAGVSPRLAAFVPVRSATAAATQPASKPRLPAPRNFSYRGAEVTAAATGTAPYAVPALGRRFATLRDAHLAINAAHFEREAGISSAALLSLYGAADSDGNGNLSWAEIVSFQSRLEHSYRYQANGTALRPDEFLAQGGGDCEDWALVTAGLLDYWGWNASIGVFADPNSPSAHAVCMVWSGAPIPGYGYFQVRSSVKLRTGTLESGCYIPIDYQSVGALTNAVGRGWKLTDIYRPVSLYDRPM